MSLLAPTIELNNGNRMPAFGLGVWQTPGDQTATAVRSAIGSGYRLIDTASAYGNEREVGEGVASGGVKRSELFVTTKLWIKDFGYDKALAAFDASMAKLGLDYLDLYLLHWPVPKTFADTVAAYRAAEKILADGRVKAIGVSNFNPDHLDRLKAETDVVPAVNQVELHPYFSQRAVRQANAERGIVTQSWSPIGGSWSGSAGGTGPLLENPVIVGTARDLGKSPAQVVLRWHLQHGLSVIPKSVNPKRIAENIDVFDFELDEARMAALDALDAGSRSGPDPDAFGAS